MTTDPGALSAEKIAELDALFADVSPSKSGMTKEDADFYYGMIKNWPTLRSAALSAIALGERVRKYQARLEIDSYHDGDGLLMVIPDAERDSFPDGITCRDETIRLQAANIIALGERVNDQAVELRELKRINAEYYDQLQTANHRAAESAMAEHELERHRYIVAFVDGAKWWEWHEKDATMWPEDQRTAETKAAMKFDARALAAGKGGS